MIDVTLTVTKEDVYKEVAKTTSFTGANMIGENKGSYDHVFTTDEDRQQLDRFWSEACNAVTEQLKPFFKDGVTDNEYDTQYNVSLELSSSFETLLIPSIQASLKSYFVSAVISRWYKISNKDDAEGYMNDAVGMLTDVMQKIYFKKRPKRVVPV